MRLATLQLIGPEAVVDVFTSGPLCAALDGIARLADAELVVEPSTTDDPPTPIEKIGFPVRCARRIRARVQYAKSQDTPRLRQAVSAIISAVEHALDREDAVGDLADALMTGYEELDMLYGLLPNVTTKTHASQIGELLVKETARTLNCKRVSLLVLDEKRENYRVLASRGLPSDIRGLSLPLRDAAPAHALSDDDLLLVNSMSDHPGPSPLSCADGGDSFAVVRVPLQARGETLGFLAVTERDDGLDFTARDLKLLDGLSAMGASALLGCRLHTAVHEQMMSTIKALASAVDAKDHYTGDHAGRVVEFCVATARELGVTDIDDLRDIELAGLLHDIGKIGIPDAILSKPGPLSREEFETIKTHVRIGADIVKHVPGLENVAKAILHHHERHDGMGYMSRLAGDAIPIAAKLVTVTDAFDALTSDRPYRKSVGFQKAMIEIESCRGTQFDPEVADAFLKVAERTFDTTRERSVAVTAGI